MRRLWGRKHEGPDPRIELAGISAGNGASPPVAIPEPPREIYPSYGEVFAVAGARRDRPRSEIMAQNLREASRRAFKADSSMRLPFSHQAAPRRAPAQVHRRANRDATHEPRHRFAWLHRSLDHVQSNMHAEPKAVSRRSYDHRSPRQALAPARGNEPGTVFLFIAEFCRSRPNIYDWNDVHALGTFINQSEANSKEAIRALTREIKSQELQVQQRAVRAWGVWALLGAGPFSTQAANSKLLVTLEEILDNSLTFPALRKDILDVLSSLAYRSHTSERLRRVARLWARVCPSDRPLEGAPLKEPLFMDGASVGVWKNKSDNIDVSPDSIAVARAVMDVHASEITDSAQVSSAGMHQDPSTLDAWVFSTELLSKHSETSPANTSAPLPLEPEEIRSECAAAQSIAAVLRDALLCDGIHSPVAVEFEPRAQYAQDWLEAQLPQATRLAEQDEAARAEAEAMLDVMLDTLSQLGEVLALRDELCSDADESPVSSSSEHDAAENTQPSAKALGKRRAADEDDAVLAQQADALAGLLLDTGPVSLPHESLVAVGQEQYGTEALTSAPHDTRSSTGACDGPRPARELPVDPVALRQQQAKPSTLSHEIPHENTQFTIPGAFPESKVDISPQTFSSYSVQMTPSHSGDSVFETPSKAPGRADALAATPSSDAVRRSPMRLPAALPASRASPQTGKPPLPRTPRRSPDVARTDSFA